MNPIDGSIGGGGMVSENVGREYVSVEVKAEFDRLTAIIRDILIKSTYTQQDADDLASAMTELYELRKKEGFETTMNDSFVVLLVLFKGTGYDPLDPVNPSYTIDLAALQSMRDNGINLDGRIVTMDDIIMLLDPAKFTDATKKLNDMLADFVTYTYDLYARQVEQLYNMVEASRKTIGDLTSLKEILNHVEVRRPDNYVYPPQTWTDIPPEILQKLHDNTNLDVGWQYVPNPNQPGEMVWQPTKNFNLIQNYVTTPPGSNQYVTWSDEYFKRELGVTPKLQPNDAADLLTLRDDLTRQLAVMEKEGAPTGPGTPYDSVQKVLETINKALPPSDFPPLIPDPSDPLNKPPSTDWTKYLNENPDAKTKAESGTYNWIEDSLRSSSTTNDLVDKALQANQQLSDTKSKELQAKNQELTMVMDMLSQLLQTTSDMIRKTAEKLSRG